MNGAVIAAAAAAYLAARAWGAQPGRFDPPRYIPIPHPWEAPVTHAEIVTAITSKCEELALWCRVEPQAPVTARSGWVDIVILGPKGFFVEVKTASGRRTRAQIDVARRLLLAHLEYRLVREADLPGFERELEALCTS